MYYNAQLQIDPSQFTEIRIIKPSKIFAKLFHYLTAGKTSKKEESETFTAISILQQFSLIFKNLGINNLVRLTKDDVDFYFDEKGEENDWQKVMEDFHLKTDNIEAQVFNRLFLVLEHEDHIFKYLVEINIYRRHKIGEYPLKIKVNALIKDFKNNDSDNFKSLKKRMNNVFKDQESYENFIKVKKIHFEHWISNFEQEIRKMIGVDQVKIKIEQNMLRPKKIIKYESDLEKHANNSEPIYHGYSGFNNFFCYAFLWSGLAFSNNIYMHDLTVVDSIGNPIMNVGEKGFYAGEGQTLNPEVPFEAPENGDIEYFKEHDYSEEIAGIDQNDQENISDNLIGENSDSSSWLGDLFSEDSNDFSDSGSFFDIDSDFF